MSENYSSIIDLMIAVAASAFIFVKVRQSRIFHNQLQSLSPEEKAEFLAKPQSQSLWNLGAVTALPKWLAFVGNFLAVAIISVILSVLFLGAYQAYIAPN